VWVDWLVGDYLLLRDFRPYGGVFMNVCVVIAVAMVILLRDAGPNGITFDCVSATFDFPVILDGEVTSSS
jgi:hypothetical protein